MHVLQALQQHEGSGPCLAWHQQGELLSPAGAVHVTSARSAPCGTGMAGKEERGGQNSFIR